MAAELENVRIHVHEPGEPGLDGILQLIGLAERDLALYELMSAMCAEVSRIADAEVVSAYLREDASGFPVYTMRGNIGFPADAVGRVQLRLGEGIVGFVAECLRPVSVASAQRDAHYKHVPGLGEERFPALLAVPVMRASTAIGVLVLQRSAPDSFSSSEVALAAALAALFAHALDRAEQRDRDRAARTSGAARLRGVPSSGGAAMGRAVVLPTLASIARGEVDRDVSIAPASLPAAIERLQRDVARARRRLQRASEPEAERAIGNLSVILEDRRFGARLSQACASSDSVAALCEIARDYARVPYRTSRGGDIETMLAERAREVEDLCVLLYGALAGHKFVRAGAVVVAERMGAFAALFSIARGASACIVEGDVATSDPALAIARAAEVPFLSAVGGVFHWVRPGDLLVVDADGGSVRINPSATTVAAARSRANR